MRGGVAKKGKTAKNNTPRSVMGRLLPPVDITNDSQLSELDERIRIGPVTLVLVYADWCGHCQRFKPMMSQLEKIPGRSVQTARIRDDMFPKSSINGEKLSGYPSLMLIDKNGKSTLFKDKEGEVSNTVPDYTNMNKMATLVRNAGTPQGQTLLTGENTEATLTPNVKPLSGNTSGNKSIVADRLSTSQVNGLNAQLNNSTNPTVVASTASATQQGGMGMGLFGSLVAASKQLAPAAALFLGAEVLKSKRKTRGRRRATRRNRR
jgi:thiol-disulfide isomerase/thioredoxin